MKRFALKALLALAAAWLVVAGVIYLAREATPTPASVESYIDGHPLTGKIPADRSATIAALTGRLNRLTYDQRRELRKGHKLDSFFRELTPAEQGDFLDRTLPAGFQQMMEAFNNMPREKRQRFVERAVKDMQDRPDGEAPKTDDPNVHRIIDQGMRSFYKDASLETKLDLAPLLEQMQRRMQGQ